MRVHADADCTLGNKPHPIATASFIVESDIQAVAEDAQKQQDSLTYSTSKVGDVLREISDSHQGRNGKCQNPQVDSTLQLDETSFNESVVGVANVDINTDGGIEKCTKCQQKGRIAHLRVSEFIWTKFGNSGTGSVVEEFLKKRFTFLLLLILFSSVSIQLATVVVVGRVAHFLFLGLQSLFLFLLMFSATLCLRQDVAGLLLRQWRVWFNTIVVILLRIAALYTFALASENRLYIFLSCLVEVFITWTYVFIPFSDALPLGSFSIGKKSAVVAALLSLL